jgi:hypothetical protein
VTVMKVYESTVVLFVAVVVVMVVVVVVVVVECLDFWSILKVKKSRLFAAVDCKQGELLSEGDA